MSRAMRAGVRRGKSGERPALSRNCIALRGGARLPVLLLRVPKTFERKGPETMIDRST